VRGSNDGSAYLPQNGFHLSETKRVLIVDDHGLIRGIVRRVLENQGFQCEEAKDGLDGLVKAREFKPDLVVLDLVMPLMNGYEAAMVFHKEMPDVPVIILSMYGERFGGSLPETLGVKAVVPKSDGMGALLECVRNLLG
jgi:DNA-binding NarL/FixJ family response regulator